MEKHIVDDSVERQPLFDIACFPWLAPGGGDAEAEASVVSILVQARLSVVLRQQDELLHGGVARYFSLPEGRPVAAWTPSDFEKHFSVDWVDAKHK